MSLLGRFVLSAILLCLAPLSIARQSKTAATDESLTGRYEGRATNKAGQVIEVTLDLIDNGGALSGNIASTAGDFPILSGNRRGETVTISFDASGDTGTISLTLTGSKLVGSFTAGDDGGPVDLKKTAAPASGIATSKSTATPIMFLGVYHMDNPGLDEVSTQADDVLAPKRQREIEELVDRLARFRPTKIAIEAPYRDTYWPEQYKKYLAGQYKLGRNEIEQIGFRLAKRLNLHTLYGVDFQMFMNGLTPSEMEEPKGNQAKAGDASKAASAPLSPDDEMLRKSTVTQYLAHLNSAPEIQKNHEGYITSLLPTNDAAIYRKTDMVANWYKRNLRIFADINRITDRGKDRVLVIIGTGHLKLLKEFAADSTYFEVADAETLLTP